MEMAHGSGRSDYDAGTYPFRLTDRAGSTGADIPKDEPATALASLPNSTSSMVTFSRWLTEQVVSYDGR